MAGRFAVSFPGRGGPSDPWFRIGTLDVTTTMLVVLMAVASMFVWAAEGVSGARTDANPWGVGAITGKLYLEPDRVFDGQVWRLVSWPIPNEPSIWIVIMIAIFWYFGSELERLLGRNRFAMFLVVVAIGTGIVGTLIDVRQGGLRTIELCVFLLFVAEYPNIRFFFGVPAWVMGAVIVGIDFLQYLGLGREDLIVLALASFAIAALTARTMGLLSNFPWIPAVPIGGNRTSRPRRSKPSRGRGGRLSRGGDVVAGPWTSTRGGPTGSAPLPQPPASTADMARDQAELDSLLDKISESGMDGLSTDEKRRLNELSKRMRGHR